MSDHETRDLMSVDSFAQLPFIRPPPRPSASAIRLFGIEVPHHPDAAAEEDALDASKDNAGAGGGGESAGPGRKFVCHYCCRQFPTSQALGGHQNAHKRERQHAKRAHHLAAVAHQGPVAVVDGHHVYGLFNYHHQHHALGHTAAAAASAYPSSRHASFYGGLGAAAPPGGGSALPPGSWRHRHHAAVLLPLTRGDQEYSRVEESGGGGVIDLPPAPAAPPPPPPPSSIPESQFEFHLNIPSSVKENVSLDLHL